MSTLAKKTQLWSTNHHVQLHKT